MTRKPKRRNPYAALVRRLGHRIKPSKKIYTRKGRSKHRPFGVLGRTSGCFVGSCRTARPFGVGA